MRPERASATTTRHALVDDHSRLAYVELHDDETAATVTGFVERALAFYESHGISAQRLMTDNAFTYVKNRTLRELLATLAASRTAAPSPTGPAPTARSSASTRPWPANGATASYRSHRHRAEALPHWIDHYNRHRPHSSLGDRPPISRVHNVPGQDN